MTYEVVKDGVPKSIVINNSISWRTSLPDFPATAWTLSYSFVNAAGRIIVTAAADGTDHLVEIPPTTSTGYTAGEYKYQAFVVNGAGSERYKVADGDIEIIADYAEASSGLETRSWAKITLDAIEDVITGKVAHDRASYSIHGRSLAAYSWDEILQLHVKFKSMYSAELRVVRKMSSSALVTFR